MSDRTADILKPLISGLHLVSVLGPKLVRSFESVVFELSAFINAEFVVGPLERPCTSIQLRAIEFDQTITV